MNDHERMLSPLYTEIEAWFRQGHALRRRLEEERHALLERVRAIDAMLGSLPNESVTVATPHVLPGPHNEDGSMPEKILSVLKMLDQPMTATELSAYLGVQDTDLVHVALSRLVKRELVAAEGDRGSRRYRVARDNFVLRRR